MNGERQKKKKEKNINLVSKFGNGIKFTTFTINKRFFKIVLQMS